MKPIIALDFAGTLIKPEIVEEANEFRTAILNRNTPSRDEHAHPEALYKINNEYVEKLTGITKDMQILYRENTLEEISLSGAQVQTQIMTNLFQMGMYMTAKKHKKGIFPDNLLNVLKKLQKTYDLVIVTGIRTDIVAGMLAIVRCPIQFASIYGQPPILGVSNEKHLQKLSNKDNVLYVIGDKLSDLEPAKKINASTIYVAWGHASGGEEQFADYTVRNPSELLQILLNTDAH